MRTLGTDLVLRPLLAKVSENMKQSFVLDSRAGANGVIGTELAVKSPPDGYTLVGTTSGTLTINPNVYAKLPFDPERDLAPAATPRDIVTKLHAEVAKALQKVSCFATRF
jgi:tripartite-type tricarboxylate transporter receptor subunit TctC